MSLSRLVAAATLLTLPVMPAFAETEANKLEKGAQAYRICAACHSLQPGVHLSGPSLANSWGKEAASLEDYGRYTEALRTLGVTWDENTLNAWLADPQAMAPGTTMTFRGIEDDETREALIIFLRKALSEGGGEEVVKDGLVPQAMAEGQIPPDLSQAKDAEKVAAIRHCRDAFFITMATGQDFPFWETNVRLKIDTSERGPSNHDIVLLRSGMAGDRISVVFPSRTKLVNALEERCQ